MKRDRERERKKGVREGERGSRRGERRDEERRKERKEGRNIVIRISIIKKVDLFGGENVFWDCVNRKGCLHQTDL